MEAPEGPETETEWLGRDYSGRFSRAGTCLSIASAVRVVSTLRLCRYSPPETIVKHLFSESDLSTKYPVFFFFFFTMLQSL